MSANRRSSKLLLNLVAPLSSHDKDREHPRPLLLFTKLTIVGTALFYCSNQSPVTLPLFRVLAGISVIVLLPRFGWLVPITLASMLFSLPVHEPDNFLTIGSVTAGGFVLGCVFDYLAKISLKPVLPANSDPNDAG